MPKLSPLVSLGLSPHATRIYERLLDLSLTNVAELARKTRLHPTQVQSALEELQTRGCVSMSQRGKRKWYLAEDPACLQIIADQVREEVEVILPELQARFRKRQPLQQIRFFTGKEGLRAVYTDLLSTLKNGEVFFRYESPSDYKQQDVYLPKAYWERVCKQRQIQKFVITNEGTAKQKPSQLERSVQVVPGSFDPFIYDLTQIIYANKVAVLDFMNENAWLIENERFANFQRQLFKLLFSKLKK